MATAHLRGAAGVGAAMSTTAHSRAQSTVQQAMTTEAGAVGTRAVMPALANSVFAINLESLGTQLATLLGWRPGKLLGRKRYRQGQPDYAHQVLSTQPRLSRQGLGYEASHHAQDTLHSSALASASQDQAGPGARLHLANLLSGQHSSGLGEADPYGDPDWQQYDLSAYISPPDDEHYPQAPSAAPRLEWQPPDALPASSMPSLPGFVCTGTLTPMDLSGDTSEYPPIRDSRYLTWRPALTPARGGAQDLGSKPAAAGAHSSVLAQPDDRGNAVSQYAALQRKQAAARGDSAQPLPRSSQQTPAWMQSVQGGGLQSRFAPAKLSTAQHGGSPEQASAAARTLSAPPAVPLDAQRSQEAWIPHHIVCVRMGVTDRWSQARQQAPPRAAEPAPTAHLLTSTEPSAGELALDAANEQRPAQTVFNAVFGDSDSDDSDSSEDHELDEPPAPATARASPRLPVIPPASSPATYSHSTLPEFGAWTQPAPQIVKSNAPPVDSDALPAALSAERSSVHSSPAAASVSPSIPPPARAGPALPPHLAAARSAGPATAAAEQPGSRRSSGSARTGRQESKRHHHSSSSYRHRSRRSRSRSTSQRRSGAHRRERRDGDSSSRRRHRHADR